MTSNTIKRLLLVLFAFLVAVFLVVGYAASTKRLCSSNPFLQKYNCSLKRIKVAAREGNAEAQYALGYIYFYGVGVARDPKAATVWILRAAASGHPLAIKAKGLLKKYQSSFDRVKSAAQEGNPSAQYALGYLYFYGIGTARNPKAAKVWILRAAAKGHPLAIKAKQLLHYNANPNSNSTPSVSIPAYSQNKSPYSAPVKAAKPSSLPDIGRVRN